jgi:hypothetical protein
MSKGYFVNAKKVVSGGYLLLLQAPFGTAAVTVHCLDVPFWSGVSAGAAQVQYWLLRSQPRQGGQ